MTSVLEMEGVEHAYRRTVALRGVSLTVEAGEVVAVTGPSGCGKSTLLHVAAGMLRPQAGDVRLLGQELSLLDAAERTKLRRRRVGVVLQFGQLVPDLPAIENVALPLILNGASIRDAKATANTFFAPLGLDGLQDRRPGQMSGGQSQRVAIARALATKPSVLFADEPTGALDAQTSWEVMRLLRESAQQIGSALVVVTHDLEVARWCDRTLVMQAGSLVAQQVAA
jgi:putative ABC transport system ATP-binding protein